MRQAPVLEQDKVLSIRFHASSGIFNKASDRREWDSNLQSASSIEDLERRRIELNRLLDKARDGYVYAQ